MQLRTAAALLATLSVARPSASPHTHGEAGQRERGRQTPSLPPSRRGSPTHGKEGNPQRRLAAQTADRKAGRARLTPSLRPFLRASKTGLGLGRGEHGRRPEGRRARCIFSRCSAAAAAASGGATDGPSFLCGVWRCSGSGSGRRGGQGLPACRAARFQPDPSRCKDASKGEWERGSELGRTDATRLNGIEATPPLAGEGERGKEGGKA